MGIFKLLFSNPTAILKAIIAFDDDDNTSIEFKKFHPEMNSMEYVRITLHYYAKILFNFDPNQTESHSAYALLLEAIDNISRANLKNNPNVLEIADIDDVITLSTKLINQKHRYIATLYSGLGVERHIKTKIPLRMYLQHMTFTVPILIQGVLSYLNMKEIDVLQLALKFMNKQYKDEVDFHDIKNLSSVPTNAYISAIKCMPIESS